MAQDKLTYQQLLQAIQGLPPADQIRLRDDLNRMTHVRLARPAATDVAIQQGKRLAEAVRQELALSMTGSLDEVMLRLRGQSWLS